MPGRQTPAAPGDPPNCLTGDWEGVSGAMLQLSWGVPGEPGGDGVGHRSPLAPGDTAGWGWDGNRPRPLLKTLPQGEGNT